MRQHLRFVLILTACAKAVRLRRTAADPLLDNAVTVGLGCQGPWARPWVPP